MRGLEGACGASTPPDDDPGERRLGGPIDPGGRGMLSKPGGVCASAGEPRTHASRAAKAWRPRGWAANGIMPSVYRCKSGEFKPLRHVCQRSGVMLGAAV